MAEASIPAVVEELKWERLPKIVFNEEKGQLTVYLPGFTYSDIDKSGNLTVWSAACYAEAGRAQIFFAPDLPFVNTFLQGYFYLVSAIYEFSPDFYDKDCRFNPLRDEVNVTNISKQSYTQYDKIWSTVTGKLLLTSTVALVHVDKATRKPRSLPSSFKERFGSHAVQLPGNKVSKIERPVKTFIVSYQIQWSDADFFRHSNQAAYIRYCFNAAETLVKQNVLSRITGDIGDYRVLRCICLFLKETLPGETANIHVWEEETNKFNLYFHIEMNKILRYQGSIEFQPLDRNQTHRKSSKSKL